MILRIDGTPIDPSKLDDTMFAPWLFEIVGPIVWVLMALHYFRRFRREGELSLHFLVFLGATTMFWLEWYADWGGYVLYNSNLHLIPHWDWPMTSPNKPWAVIPAYGWFFGAIYLPLIDLLQRLHTRLQRSLNGLPGFPVFLLTVGFVFHYAWDLLIEGTAVMWGLWDYTTVVGPAIHGSRGDFPLVFPIIPFAFAMSAIMLILDAKTTDGTPVVERWARVDRFTGAKHHVARLVTWVLVMNATYALIFTAPLMVFRALFLPHDPLM